jgi:drug/metabolite transporter (DMT)-like permease
MFDVSIALALAALFFYGITQVLSKYAVGSLNAVSMVAINFLATFPIYLVFLIATLLFVDIGSIGLEYFVFGAVGVCTARGGYYLYMEALEKASVTMVGSITAAYPAITVLLAITILGEAIAPLNALGVAVIIVSMIILSYKHRAGDGKSAFSKEALTLSLAVMAIWGVGGIFIKAALTGMPLVAYLGLYPLLLPPLAFAYLKHRKATWKVFSLKWTVPIMAAIAVAVMWQLGYFGETGAISQGSAAIIFPIISAYPIVTIVGAYFLLKERVSRIEWGLLLCVIAGILLTSM